MKKLVIGIVILVIVIGSVFAQTVDIFLFNDYEDPIYARVLYWDLEHELVVSDLVLIQPGREHFFGTTESKNYYVTCFDEERTHYLIEPDTPFSNEDGPGSGYYRERSIDSDFDYAIRNASSFKWREVIPGSYTHFGFESLRRTTLLNDTNLTVRLVIDAYAFLEEHADKWITLEPGESLYLGEEPAHYTTLRFYGTATDSYGNRYFYASDEVVRTVQDPEDSSIEYVTAAARTQIYDTYSEKTHRLSQVERHDWLCSVEVELDYGQTFAISYYDNGRWHDRVVTSSTTFYMDSNEFYYVFFDRNINRFFFESSSYGASAMREVIEDDRSPKYVVTPKIVTRGKRVSIFLEDGQVWITK
jgi:hypothetical protein